MIGNSMTQDRKTFTVPDGFEAVRDEEGRATGEVRPTQPTTQAIQQAREIAAELYPSSKTAILNGEWDASNSVKVILRALSVSASEREALEARVKELEAALQQIAAFVPKDKSDGGTEEGRREWNRAGTYAQGIARAALNGAKRP